MAESRTMKISFSVPSSDLPEEVIRGAGASQIKFGQTVHFFNMSEGYITSAGAPEEVSYAQSSPLTVALLNYNSYEVVKEVDGVEKTVLTIDPQQGWGLVKSVGSTNEDLAVTIFRQEIGFDERGNETPLTPYQPVDTYVTRFHLRDFNVANNRYYKYIIYPASEDRPLMSVEQTVLAKWDGWSITELHPLDTSGKRFSATADDVWVFNANVTTGSQTQNIVVNQQQTLGEYARYSQAPQNFISSNVSCLLGQVLPANYIKKMTAYNVKDAKTGLYRTKTGERYISMGGYQETVPTSLTISSNDKIDMLLAWRKLVHSGNPKLLKDRKGQSFLIAITESSNQPMDNNRKQPDTISFNWVQIGTLEDVQIIGTSL